LNICVIGTGYVGLVVGTCLAEMGNNVTCVDNDTHKLAMLSKGEIPIYEPGLKELVLRNSSERRLEFSSDLGNAVRNAQVVYIAVGTPQGDDGSADLTAVRHVARVIGENLSDGYTVVVNKSTVPVGTGDAVRSIISEYSSGCGQFNVVSNPEFLKEGCAIDDFMRPDRIIIGTDSERASEIMQYLYAPLVRTEKPILFMDIRSAEMSKYAANAFLSTKISFINEVANLCEHLGADINHVRRGVGSDSRIGFKFLFPGVGYGGSCFPKDVKALHSMGLEVGYEARILNAVDQVNSDQKKLIGTKILRYFGGDLSGRTIAVWGLAFKPQTDDMREAPSLVLIQQLLSAGATVKVFDPVAMDEARKYLDPGVQYALNSFSAIENADALALVTEWNEFRRPDLSRMARLMRGRAVFDGRNIYDTRALEEVGLEHFCVGRTRS